MIVNPPLYDNMNEMKNIKSGLPFDPGNTVFQSGNRKKSGLSGRVPTGFTLIEILVVVFIVSLLLSLAALEGVKLRRMANDMNAQANLKSIATSLEVYAAGHDGFYAVSPADNLGYLVEGKYAAQDFTTLNQIGNFRYVIGSIDPQGYDVRAMAVNPVLAGHNYQILAGAKILRSDTSLSNDTDFKSFNG